MQSSLSAASWQLLLCMVCSITSWGTRSPGQLALIRFAAYSKVALYHCARLPSCFDVSMLDAMQDGSLLQHFSLLILLSIFKRGSFSHVDQGTCAEIFLLLM